MGRARTKPLSWKANVVPCSWERVQQPCPVQPSLYWSTDVSWCPHPGSGSPAASCSPLRFAFLGLVLRGFGTVKQRRALRLQRGGLAVAGDAPGIGDAGPGVQGLSWDLSAGRPEPGDKVPKLNSPQCCWMLRPAPCRPASQRTSQPCWRWGEDGKLSAAAALGVQFGHRDEPLPLEGCAALGQVPNEGRLRPWGRFGARLAKPWCGGGEVGPGTSKMTSTSTWAACGPCPGPARLLELQLGRAG